MAREKKVITRNANTYDSSSDDESSEDEIDYSSLFKGLDRTFINFTLASLKLSIKTSHLII